MIQPPKTNGIMQSIPCTKEDLKAIIDGFKPTYAQPKVTTFYIVSVWNQEHSDTPINGDTAESVLEISIN